MQPGVCPGLKLPMFTSQCMHCMLTEFGMASKWFPTKLDFLLQKYFPLVPPEVWTSNPPIAVIANVCTQCLPYLGSFVGYMYITKTDDFGFWNGVPNQDYAYALVVAGTYWTASFQAFWTLLIEKWSFGAARELFTAWIRQKHVVNEL